MPNQDPPQRLKANPYSTALIAQMRGLEIEKTIPSIDDIYEAQHKGELTRDAIESINSKVRSVGKIYTSALSEIMDELGNPKVDRLAVLLQQGKHRMNDIRIALNDAYLKSTRNSSQWQFAIPSSKARSKPLAREESEDTNSAKDDFLASDQEQEEAYKADIRRQLKAIESIVDFMELPSLKTLNNHLEKIVNY